MRCERPTRQTGDSLENCSSLSSNGKAGIHLWSGNSDTIPSVSSSLGCACGLEVQQRKCTSEIQPRHFPTPSLDNFPLPTSRGMGGGESRRRRRSCAPWNGGIISMWLWFNSLLTQTSSTRNNRFPGIFLVPFPWLSSHPVGHPGWILGCFHFSSSVLVE